MTGSVEVRLFGGNGDARREGLEGSGARLEGRGATAAGVGGVRGGVGVGPAFVLLLPVSEVDTSRLGLEGEEGFVGEVDPGEVVFDTVGESHAKCGTEGIVVPFEVDGLGGEESRVVGDVVEGLHAKCAELAFGGGDYVDFAKVATKFFAVEVPAVKPDWFNFVIEVVFSPAVPLRYKQAYVTCFVSELNLRWLDQKMRRH